MHRNTIRWAELAYWVMNDSSILIGCA